VAQNEKIAATNLNHEMTAMIALRRYLNLSDLMLLLVAVVWGTSYGVAKQTFSFYPVLGVLALRFGISFVVLLPGLLTLRQVSWREIAGAVGTGLMLFAVLAAEMSGITLTTAANAAFLISLCVGFTPMVEWLILKRRPRSSEWLAAAVSVLGAAMLAGGGSVKLNPGDGLIVLAAALRALNVCVTRRVMLNTKLSSLSVTGLQSGVVAAGSIVACFVVNRNGLPALPSFGGHLGFWIGVVYLSVACTLFAFFAQNYALTKSSPTRAALLMGSEPAFGAVFACLLLGESVSVMGWLGGGLIVLASIASTMPQSFVSFISFHSFPWRAGKP
jgi:drug/metabolite transporter (DMT)-like permease